MSLSICIFARNEERRLPLCVKALDAAANGVDYRAHILVNGCTDQTAATAQALAAADFRISVHELPVGDKANTWNDYVYRIANGGGARAHIFLDGDIVPCEGAFRALTETLLASPEAYGAAALPASGRSRRVWRAALRANHYLSGNLYALSSAALAQFRARALRLPFGAKGEDGLLSYLLLTDFAGGADDTHKHRIAIAENARFEFQSLSVNLTDMRIYRRRLMRYSERHFQKQILYRLLKENGVVAMPDSIWEIYAADNLRGLRPRRDPVNFWFDLMTLKRLRGSEGPARIASV